jgi:glycosyltransferase involved in cell wall biosynthesis
MTEESRPKISVIIPTYNQAEYLSVALKSVLQQTYDNLEVIIIDNHSSDNTDEVISKFRDSRISSIKMHNNGVIAASRNAGIIAAKGLWVAFLDSDDSWMPEKLEICVHSINEKTDLIYHNLKISNYSQKIFSKKIIKSRQASSLVFNDLMLNGNLIPNSSVIVRRKLLYEIGLMSEEPKMIGAEDYNAWLRISLLTNNFIHIPKVLGCYLIGDHNISNKDMSKPTFHAVEKFLPLLCMRDRIKVKSMIRYMNGRFNYLNGNYIYAKKILQNILFYGCIKHKIKSLIMLVKIYYLFLL